jgi:phenylacetate-CoA ligase
MDYLPLEELRELQLRRLVGMVSLAYEKQELFRSRLDERGLRPENIRSLDDIALLPFTVKTDLRDTYPFGLFAKPMEQIVRLHASSGTTGKPIVVAYTKNDIDVWADAMRRSFICAGLGAHDIIQNSYGYGLFTGGLGAHYGGEKLGATVIPTSGGNTDRQIMVMKDFGVTAICCTPSYLAYLLERAEEMGVNVRDLPIKAAILGAEPWAWETGKRLEEMGGLKVYDIYGLSEIVGPGVGMMCAEQEGMHIFEDYFYPEIIDPETCEVLPDGQEGELVLTTLAKEAMPMIRYRTRDITSIITEPCACGRTCRRINRIGRRSDDMMILRGVNIFPSQIETALMAVEGTLPHYQIVLSTQHGLDQMEVQVEVTAEHFGDRIRELESLQLKLAKSIERIVGIRIDVTLVKPQTIERSQGKAKRVIDMRKK